MDNKLKHIFSEISEEVGLKVRYDTHYDANNYEFEKWEGKKLHRLDFQPLQNETIKVTHYIDSFRCCPKLLIWCHNNLPNFAYLAKIEHQNICTIDIDEKELKEKILKIINKTL